MMSKDNRYKYYVHEKKDHAIEIIAVSSYAGRRVKGKAVCSPEDRFDADKGKELAKLRCAIKIENKRLKKAIREKSLLLDLEAEIEHDLAKREECIMDTLKTIKENEAALEFLLEELNN